MENVHIFTWNEENRKFKQNSYNVWREEGVRLD